MALPSLALKEAAEEESDTKCHAKQHILGDR